MTPPRAVPRWTPVLDSDLEVSGDGEQFRWTFDRDTAWFLATEKHDDTSRQMLCALAVADELRRIHQDVDRFGFTVVMVPR